MSKCINRSGNSAELFVTYGTVDYGVIATLVYTIGIYVVLNNFLALGVTGCRNNGVNSANLCLTYGTVNYGVITAINGTLRCYVILDNGCAVGVTECVNNSVYSAELFVTYGTVDYGVVATIVFAIRSYVVLGNGSAVGVTKCVNNSVYSAELFATYGTVNYGVIAALVYAVGSYVVLDNRSAIGMTGCGNNGISSLKHLTTFGVGAVNYGVVATGVCTIRLYVILDNRLSRSVANLNGCGKHLRDSIYRIEFCVCHFKLGNGNGIFAGGGACRNLNCHLCNVIGFYGCRLFKVEPGIYALVYAGAFYNLILVVGYCAVLDDKAVGRFYLKLNASNNARLIKSDRQSNDHFFVTAHNGLVCYCGICNNV